MSQTVAVTESFQWLKPIASHLKKIAQDTGTAMYRVVASHADIKNRNGRVYTSKEMQAAAASLSERQLDLNHRDDKILPEPNQVLLAREEGGLLECVIQVDENIERMIDSGEITSVSVDGVYLDESNNTQDTEMPTSLHFRRLALLTKDTSPGDPFTSIVKDYLKHVTDKKLAKSGSIEKIRLSDIRQEGQTHSSTMPSTKQSVASVKRSKDAVWSTAYVNNLPDSSFAAIQPGGQKDADGKTTPRSLRSLPYKDATGKVDLPHLRNALARLSQTKLPDNLMASAKTKLLAAAKSAGIQSSIADALIRGKDTKAAKVFKERDGSMIVIPKGAGKTRDDWILIDPQGDEDIPVPPDQQTSDAADDEKKPADEEDWPDGKKPFPGAAKPFKKQAKDDDATCPDCNYPMSSHGDGGSCPPPAEAQDDDDDDSDDQTIAGDAGDTTQTGQNADPDGGDDGPDADVDTTGDAPDDGEDDAPDVEEQVAGAGNAYAAQFAGKELPKSKDGSTPFLSNGNNTMPGPNHTTIKGAGGSAGDPHPRDPNMQKDIPDQHSDNDDDTAEKHILQGAPPDGTVDSMQVTVEATSSTGDDSPPSSGSDPDPASDPKVEEVPFGVTTTTQSNPNDTVTTNPSTTDNPEQSAGITKTSDSLNLADTISSVVTPMSSQETVAPVEKKAAEPTPAKDSAVAPAPANPNAKTIKVEVDVTGLTKIVDKLATKIDDMVEHQKQKDAPKNALGQPVKEAYYETNKARFTQIFDMLKRVKEDIASSGASNALGQVWLPDMIVLPLDLPANLRNFCQVQMIEKGADRCYFTRITTPRWGSLTEDTGPTDVSQTIDRITSTPTETGVKQRVSYIVMESSTPDIVAAVERAFMVGAILDEDLNVITALDGCTPAAVIYGDQSVTTEITVTAAMTFTPKMLAESVKFIGSVGKYVVNPGDAVAVVGPIQYTGLLENTAISNWYQYGSFSPIQQGTIPQIYGVDLVKSTQVITGTGASSLVTYHSYVFLKPSARNAYGLGLGGAVGLGISRDLLMETWRRVDERDLYIVASHRIAAAVIQPLAVVKIISA